MLRQSTSVNETFDPITLGGPQVLPPGHAQSQIAREENVESFVYCAESFRLDSLHWPRENDS